ncbi:MAG: hypothetical protein RL693_2497 [Verrucomicrobiota bacterium]|jgi:hypothetical protein
MKAAVQLLVTKKLVSRIYQHLPHAPLRALELLMMIPCESERLELASMIANVWARQDVTTAWNAISRSKLSAAEKQIMFNELWG